MPAPRKPAGEKHRNRWISFDPEMNAYLDYLPVGDKSQAVHDALAASPGFKLWKGCNEELSSGAIDFVPEVKAVLSSIIDQFHEGPRVIEYEIQPYQIEVLRVLRDALKEPEITITR